MEKKRTHPLSTTLPQRHPQNRDPKKSAWRLSEGEFSTPSPAPTTVTTTSTIRHRAKSPASSSKRCGLFGEKELSSLPAADCGPKAAKDPAEKSEKLTRLRVCGFASYTGKTAGAARTEAPSPGPAGPGAALPRCGPAAKPPAERCQRTLRGPSRAAQERRNRSGRSIKIGNRLAAAGKCGQQKWKLGRGFLPISSPAADTGNTPRSCPQDGKKGPSAVCINIQNIVNTGAGRRRPSGGSPCEKRNKLSIKRR